MHGLNAAPAAQREETLDGLRGRSGVLTASNRCGRSVVDAIVDDDDGTAARVSSCAHGSSAAPLDVQC